MSRLPHSTVAIHYLMNKRSSALASDTRRRDGNLIDGVVCTREIDARYQGCTNVDVTISQRLCFAHQHTFACPSLRIVAILLQDAFGLLLYHAKTSYHVGVSLTHHHSLETRNISLLGRDLEIGVNDAVSS